MPFSAAYLAFDPHPSSKGASTHITHFYAALDQTFGPAALLTLPGHEDVSPELAERYFAFVSEEPNYLRRGEAFAQWADAWLAEQPNLTLVHFRDIWGGLAVLRRPHLHSVYEVNGLPSIDLNDWQPTPSEVEYAQQWRAEHAPGKSVLGMVGQLKAKKGLAFFLETLRQIPVQDRMHLLLVGELPEEEQNLLSEVAVSYTHLPFLDRFELLKYYPCCDGVCIPSYYDGMPNVLLEAGGLGIPVLASDVDGMHDVLHDVTPHLLFPVGDAHGLRKVLFDWLQADTATRQGWGQDLKTHIEQNYTVAHELDAYENLLASL